TVHLADAAAGVTPAGWEGIERWHTRQNLPDFIPELADVSLMDYNTTMATLAMAKYFPDNTFAEYNTFLDQTQVGYYGIMTGVQVSADNLPQVHQEWAHGLLPSLRSIRAQPPNFKSYTAGGMLH